MRGFEIERTLDEDTCSMETLPEKILKVPGIALVAAGTPACLIGLYDSAARINSLDRLFLCQISSVEYSLGKQGKKIWEAVELAANTEGIRGVIIYSSCMEVLTMWDFQREKKKIQCKVPVEILYRGPLVKRLATPLEELKMIFSAYSYRLLLSQLRNHQIDGCICPKGLIVPLEHMAFLDLPPLQNVLLYSRKHCPPENGQEYTVKDFRKEKLLLLEQEDTSIPKAYQLGFLQDKGIIPETKEYHNIDSILLDVSLDKGFAISDIWSRGAFDRNLSCLKLDQKMPICVAWPENHSFDEMRLFANLFKESMESLQ